MVHMDMGIYGDGWGGPARQTPTTHMCTVVNNGHHHTTDHRTPHTHAEPSRSPQHPCHGPAMGTPRHTPYTCNTTHIQCNTAALVVYTIRGLRVEGQTTAHGDGAQAHTHHTTHNMATCSGASHLGQSIARQYGNHEAPRGKALYPKS